jgi:hypothetical protein
MYGYWNARLLWSILLILCSYMQVQLWSRFLHHDIDSLSEWSDMLGHMYSLLWCLYAREYSSVLRRRLSSFVPLMFVHVWHESVYNTVSIVWFIAAMCPSMSTIRCSMQCDEYSSLLW